MCVCLCVWVGGLLSRSKSSDRGESSVAAGSRLRATGERANPALHVPWSPSSTHPVALASLPIQGPVSSSEDADAAIECAQ